MTKPPSLISALSEVLLAFSTVLAEDISGHRMHENKGAMNHSLTIQDKIATVCRKIR